MKKIWKYPNCGQISSRHWNLKRHIERKHYVGQPYLEYISGNSTFNSSSTATPPYSIYDHYQNIPFRKIWSNNIFHPLTLHMKDNYDLEEKWFDRFSLYELRLMINQLSNMIHAQYFPQPPTQMHGSFIGDPSNTAFNEIQDKHTRTFDGVIGFKIKICEKCLATITLDIGPNTEDWRIQDFHKCNPGTLAATKLLDPAQYSFNLFTKLNKIPELLFQKCKEWANNTTGMLYLIATRSESLDKYEVQIPENYEEIPWLNKVLVESKIKLNDAELNEFLWLVKNRTTELFTFKGGGATEKLVYKIGVSTVPPPSE